MNPPKWKIMMKKYGLMFFGVFLLTFFLMITFDGKFKFPSFVGDIRLGGLLYLPFGTSTASAFFVTILFEAYKMIKRG